MILKNAKEQMDAFAGNDPVEKIAYIVINFDDNFHEYAADYRSQIDAFVTTCSFADLFIEFRYQAAFLYCYELKP